MSPYSEYIQEKVISENSLDSEGKIKDDYRRIQESLELGSWRYIIDKDILSLSLVLDSMRDLLND